MQPFFKSAVEGYRAALDAYKADVKQLIGIEKRLIGEYKASASCGNDAKCKTIDKQITGVHAGIPIAEQKLHAKVDEINENVVRRFRGLCSMAKGPGLGSAGARYLLNEADEFGKSKGDYAKRQALYDGIVTIAEALADSLDKQRTETSGTVTQVVDQNLPRLPVLPTHERKNFKF